MPQIEAGQYIIEAMMALGPIRSNGFGVVATDWDIIAPFVAVTNRLAEAWEVETLADMCKAFAKGHNGGAHWAAFRSPVERNKD